MSVKRVKMGEFNITLKIIKTHHKEGHWEAENFDTHMGGDNAIYMSLYMQNLAIRQSYWP